MEINLRKANAIQAEIRKAISAVKLEANVSVNEYTQDVGASIASEAIKYLQAVARKEQLVTALFNIRKSVSNANATAGINTLLGDVEMLDQIMAVNSQVTTQTVGKSLTEIIARIEKLKATPADSSRSAIYGDRFNVVETSVVAQESIDAAKQKVKDLKRQRQALQDKLLSLNVNTLITINGADEVVLKEEGIL